ncbi:hypothetical protein [Cellulomonas sp. URHE0023]|uniref:hypothetical protein n=1 Tax=Cellulomonas sp. URHE0023 TaxID=1380354 RepID=UPI0004836E5F|nr:hypothetical protein [Cellulomonas sp. URHE0023]
MTSYLSAESIKAALDALGISRALPALTDYLIFKRAVVIQAGDPDFDLPQEVRTGKKSEPFLTAVREMAAWRDDLEVAPEEGSPYLKPFGYDRDKTGRGYVSHRYWSNGPSDTVNSWQFREPGLIIRVAGKSPMTFTFPETTDPEALQRILLLGNAQIPLPRLIDCAVWWFRFADLDAKFGVSEPSDERLVDQFVADLGLNDVEIRTLFDRA